MGGKGTYTLPAPSWVTEDAIFGRRLPPGIGQVIVTAHRDRIGLQVSWITATGRHEHFMPDLDDDNITALLVVMRLTCS